MWTAAFTYEAYEALCRVPDYAEFLAAGLARGRRPVDTEGGLPHSVDHLGGQRRVNGDQLGEDLTAECLVLLRRLRFLDTEEAWPFWEYVQDKNVPIFLHPPRVRS